MILVDTSIWIDHLNKGNALLKTLLGNGDVLMHPYVMGEIACGNLNNRKEILSLLHALPQINKADDDEVLFYSEKHKLLGLGIGLIDIHLLASCKLAKAKLLTKDRRLKDAAAGLNLLAG